MNRDFFWLTQDQFARLKPLLPSDTRGKPRVDDRRVISGIVHVLKSGGRWIDAPDVYGPHKTLYNRFVRWAAKGVWIDIFDILASAGGPPAQVLIDSSAVKAHRSPDAVEAELARVRHDAADSNVNLMPALIDAVNAHATVGEVVDALADVFGRFREDPRL